MLLKFVLLYCQFHLSRDSHQQPVRYVRHECKISKNSKKEMMLHVSLKEHFDKESVLREKLDIC